MNKKDINIDEQTECQDNMTDMNENVEEQAAEQATEATDTADADDNSDNSEKSGEYGEENSNEKSPLEEAQQQIDELKDKYLRSVAEFDNYRKRTLKEKAELLLNGSEKAVCAFLPILDDFERAIADKTEDVNAIKEGMQIIFNKFNKTLESLGVKKIETEGKDFDVDFHEAVAMVPGMGDDKKGKVIDCVQTGYQLNDKVIRHAKVAVGQ